MSEPTREHLLDLLARWYASDAQMWGGDQRGRVLDETEHALGLVGVSQDALVNDDPSHYFDNAVARLRTLPMGETP